MGFSEGNSWVRLCEEGMRPIYLLDFDVNFFYNKSLVHGLEARAVVCFFGNFIYFLYWKGFQFFFP